MKLNPFARTALYIAIILSAFYAGVKFSDAMHMVSLNSRALSIQSNLHQIASAGSQYLEKHTEQEFVTINTLVQENYFGQLSARSGENYDDLKVYRYGGTLVVYVPETQLAVARRY